MRFALLVVLVAVSLILIPRLDSASRSGEWSLGVASAWAQEEDGEDGEDGEDEGDDDDDDDEDRDRRRPTRDRDRTPLFGGEDDPEPSPRQAPVARPAPTPEPVAPPSPIPRPEPAPEVLVAVPDAAMLDAVAGTPFSLLDSAPSDLVGATLARFAVPPGMTRQEAEDALAQLLPEALVTGNTLYRTQDFSCSDAGCEAFGAVGWPAHSSCSIAPHIAMIDTGLERGHPAFPQTGVEQVSVLGAGRDPARRAHGTAVALLLVGQEDSATPGLLPNAHLTAAEAFHRGVFGDNVADVFDVVRAMERLSSPAPDVMTLSFAGAANPLLERAVAAVLARDVTVVAAVGNGGPQSEPAYPAAYEGVLGATAVGADAAVFGQAGQGAQVDLAAPGVNLEVADTPDGKRRVSGTSYAAPIVVAAAALEAFTGAGSPNEVAARLMARAKDLGARGRDPVFGAGLVQFSDCPSG